MNYIVIVRYIARGKVWKTYQREFNNLEAAEGWAKQMYECTHKGEEVTVLLYELKDSLT